MSQKNFIEKTKYAGKKFSYSLSEKNRLGKVTHVFREISGRRFEISYLHLIKLFRKDPTIKERVDDLPVDTIHNVKWLIEKFLEKYKYGYGIGGLDECVVKSVISNMEMGKKKTKKIIDDLMQYPDQARRIIYKLGTTKTETFKIIDSLDLFSDRLKKKTINNLEKIRQDEEFQKVARIIDPSLHTNFFELYEILKNCSKRKVTKPGLTLSELEMISSKIELPMSEFAKRLEKNPQEAKTITEGLLLHFLDEESYENIYGLVKSNSAALAKNISPYYSKLKIIWDEYKKFLYASKIENSSIEDFHFMLPEIKYNFNSGNLNFGGYLKINRTSLMQSDIEIPYDHHGIDSPVLNFLSLLLSIPAERIDQCKSKDCNNWFVATDLRRRYCCDPCKWRETKRPN